MSTLSGATAKGEKGKQKYLSLDINSLFNKNRGDSSETNQHKKSNARQHGMQSLGKVPSARRPANLPSLKSECNGNDPAVSLVPSGGTGWGNKPGEVGPPPVSNTPPPPTTSPPVVATATVTTTTATTAVAPPPVAPPAQDKSWSSITSSNLETSPAYFAHQSPYFQQEFPSLSGEGSTGAGLGTNKLDPAHLPGPSLRPQNEGTWIQGGGRGQGQMAVGVGNQQGIVPAPGPLSLPQGLDVAGGRGNLGPSGVVVGPAGPLPPQHYRLMPPFMMRHNMPPGGFPSNYQHGPPRPRLPFPPDTRFMPPSRGAPSAEEEVTSRPIIKEEDLKVMDEIGKDTGWAAHDEIDYNQTLSFSDEEAGQDDEARGKNGRLSYHKGKRDVDPKAPDTNSAATDKVNLEVARGSESPSVWQQASVSRPPDVRQSGGLPPHQGGRPSEDDDVVVRERRRLHNEEIALAAQRAKQRKEEEEKRYEESRQAAARKLQMLEEKMRSKNGLEKEEGETIPSSDVGGLSPDKDKDRTRKNSEEIDDKSSKEHFDNFKIAQSDNIGPIRDSQSSGQHSFARQSPNNLPPRFQRQQAGENRPYNRPGTGGSDRWQGSHSFQHPHGTFGLVGAGKHSRGLRDNQTLEYDQDNNSKEKDISVQEKPGCEVSDKDRPRPCPDQEAFNKEQESDKLCEMKENELTTTETSKSNAFQNETTNERETNQDNKISSDSRDSTQRLERPQRPDSRESRASRDSRTSRDSFREDKLMEECGISEPISWSDSINEVEHFQHNKYRKDYMYEANTRRDIPMMHSYHHPRPIPGPITQERLEAADTGRSSHLVPLVWNDKKNEIKKNENTWETVSQSGDLPTSVHSITDVIQEKIEDNHHSKVVQEEPNNSAQKSEIERPVVGDNSSGGGGSGGHRSNRGGGQRGMRHDSRGPRSYRGGMSSSWRGQIPPNRRPHWSSHDHESEASDDVSASADLGKADKRQDQDRRQFSGSPKRGSRKSDKDDRITRDSNRKQEHDKNNYPGIERFDKKQTYDNNRGGFEPSGVPSRRGRGSSFRPKGSTPLGRGMVDGYGPPTTKKPFSDSLAISSNEEKKSEGPSQTQTTHSENGVNEMSHDEKMKLNQQQLSAGIIGNMSRGDFKSQTSSIPPRLQSRDGDRKERKPRENTGWRPKGSGRGSGTELGEEEGETPSEQDDRSYGDEKQNDNSRRNSNQGMSTRGNNRRQSTNRNYGRDNKYNGSLYDKEHGSRRSTVNGSGRGRDDYRERRNPDTNCSSGVGVIDDQPDNTVEEDQTVFATDTNGFQEVRSKKNVKEGNRQQKEEPQRRSKERPQKQNKPSRSQSPPNLPSKVCSDRTRSSKLAPRFMKQKEISRQQKQQIHDGRETSNTNQGLGLPTKDLTSPAPPPPVNAWSKPITGSLRTATPPTAVSTDSCITNNVEVPSSTSSQRSSPHDEKAVCKPPREPVEKALLDGTTPPLDTIIFENPNYKAPTVDPSSVSTIIPKYSRPEKPKDKTMEEENISVGFKSQGPEMQLQEVQTEPIQMPMSFSKNEDSADMKLDFRFDSELSQLTDDKTSKTVTSIQMARTMQMAAQSSAADLQFKLDAVKKVWETPPTVLQHSGEDAAPTYNPSFGNPGDDPSGYGKPTEPSVVDDSNTPENVYNPGQPMANNPNAFSTNTVQNMMKQDPSSNVCKVKPQPQSAVHPHGGPLSPQTGPFTSPAQPSPHINYQPPAQYGGMSAIPSPPTVFTQTHEQQLYQAFQINSQQVLSSQARSQFSQFPYLSQGLGQASGFSQQSMYLQTAGPPPPTAPPAPTHTHPELFPPPQLSQYRIQPPTYGGNQQLSTNPNTVLISSSTVKPPPQPIGAIGSKAASYQQPSQPPSQFLIYGDPQLINQNFLQNSQLVQRAASNVVPTIPPSTASYYSATSGGSAAGYFQPGNSSMHHIQAFSTQAPATGMGSFGSIMAQQYRSTAQPYHKPAPDLQDSPAAQINSAAPRPNGSGKQSSANSAPQQQPSPTQGYHKFSAYQQNVPAPAQLITQPNLRTLPWKMKE